MIDGKDKGFRLGSPQNHPNEWRDCPGRPQFHWDNMDNMPRTSKDGDVSQDRRQAAYPIEFFIDFIATLD